MSSPHAPLDIIVLTCLQRWDYGDPKRGQSVEDKFFVQNLRPLVRTLETYWYDEFLKDLPRLNAQLIDRVREVRPDVVFFAPFQEQVTPATLDAIRELGATTIAWFSDDQWRFEDYSQAYSAHFDLVVTTDPWAVGKYRRIGREPLLSQWAADRSPLTPIIEESEFTHDVTFVGLETPYRSWFVKRLRKLGIEVACFGHGWKAGRVSFEEMHSIFRTSRINLNLSNSVSMDVRSILHSPKSIAMAMFWSKKTEQIKARNFEIPGCGGFQMSYFVSGLDKYYVSGTEIALYEGPEDCARQIEHYLASPDERMALAVAGHARTEREHTWDTRLTEVLGTALTARTSSSVAHATHPQ